METKPGPSLTNPPEEPEGSHSPELNQEDIIIKESKRREIEIEIENIRNIDIRREQLKQEEMRQKLIERVRKLASEILDYLNIKGRRREGINTDLENYFKDFRGISTTLSPSKALLRSVLTIIIESVYQINKAYQNNPLFSYMQRVIMELNQEEERAR